MQNKIKQKFIILPKKCKICKKIFVFKKMTKITIQVPFGCYIEYFCENCYKKEND